jgi:hypothetical protein
LTRGRQWCAALTLPLLALAACGSPPTAREDSAQAGGDPLLGPGSPVALTPYAQEGNAALISGTLVLEDGCLYLRSGADRLLPTFPWPGTEWDAASQTLTIFGRQRFRVGQPVEAGGGFVTPDRGRANAETIQRMFVVPRPQCDTSRVAILYFGPNDAPVR